MNDINNPESRLIILVIIGGFFGLVLGVLKAVDGLKKLKKEHFVEFIKWTEKNKYLIVLILGFSIWFYWAQFRPSFVKKDCANKAYDRHEYMKSYSEIDRQYKECLQINGL